MDKFYFFDSSFIFSKNRTKLKLASPKKETTDISWIDPMDTNRSMDIPDWEYRVSILYPFVYYDENGISVDGISSAKYKIWYEASAISNCDTGRKWLDYIIDKDNSREVVLGDFKNSAKGVISNVHPDFHFALCYMESNDGINWHRPECGEFYYKKEDGSIIGTNIVFIGEHGEGVVKNTHPLAGKGEPRFLFACANDGVAISCSDDGIHWQIPIRVYKEFESRLQVRGDSQNHIYWSEEASRYVIITRGIEFDTCEPLRTVLTIPGPKRLCKNPEDETDLSGAVNEFIYPFSALGGPLDSQPYSMPTYRLSGGYYIGLVSLFNCDYKSDNPFRVYAALSWSKDLINWSYLCDRKPFIDNCPVLKLEKGNDFGMIYCASPIKADKKLRIYYAAVPEAHYWMYSHIPTDWKAVIDEKYPKAKEKKAITRTTSLNFATVEIDRFCGLYSEDGEITLKPIISPDGKFSLTADLSETGKITARLLDEEDRVISGFDFDDFNELNEDITEKELSWASDTSKISNRPVKIQLLIKNATIYSLKVNDKSKSSDENNLPPILTNTNK